MRTAYDDEYHRAFDRQNSSSGKQMEKLREGTVEAVFGSLTQYYGFSKIAVLGIDGVHKNMPMAAIAFKIKKYIKFSINKIVPNELQKVEITRRDGDMRACPTFLF